MVEASQNLASVFGWHPELNLDLVVGDYLSQLQR